MTDVGAVRKSGINNTQAIYKTSHFITDYTRVSGKEAHTQLFVPSVTLFKFYRYHREHVLCTLDTRRSEGTEAEFSLKFWYWHVASHSYKLAAQVDRPHGSHRVTSLDVGSDRAIAGVEGEVESKKVLCISSAVDGSVKVWRLVLSFL